MPKPTDFEVTKVSARSLNLYLPTTRISDKNQAIARAALLDGVPVPELAKIHRINAAGIYRLLITIKKGIAAMGAVGDKEWLAVNINLPQPVAHELHLWVRQIKNSATPRAAAREIASVQTAILKSRDAMTASK